MFIKIKDKNNAIILEGRISYIQHDYNSIFFEDEKSLESANLTHLNNVLQSSSVIYFEFITEDEKIFFINVSNGKILTEKEFIDSDILISEDILKNCTIILDNVVLGNTKQESVISKMVIAWDLDGTLIDSSHRIAFKEDGSFDLDYWIENCTREQIMKDELLPLSEIYFEYKRTGFTQICVTAREMSEHDFEYLKEKGLEFDIVLHRGNSKELDEVLKTQKVKDFFEKNKKVPFQAYDDKQENLEVFDNFGFRTFQAAYLNKVMDCNSLEEIQFKPKDF